MFWLPTMADMERNYSVSDQEMLAIIEACRHWRHYLEGSNYPVRVLTDHHNFQGFMKNKPLLGRLGRWWETLLRYDLEIVYCTGKTNSADNLSSRLNYGSVAKADDREKQAQVTHAGESGKA
jgi:mRNA-degrading endonuclease YafQ of YafQ-DinJ toxin-antitoxin module